MTNTANTPIEALETEFPMRVTEYSVRRGSGGAGEHPGGDGIVRGIELLEPATVSLLAERRRHGPWGLNGGEAGEPGRDSVIVDGTESELPAKSTAHFPAGTRITVRTPGGGGWGPPDSGTAQLEEHDGRPVAVAQTPVTDHDVRRLIDEGRR